MSDNAYLSERSRRALVFSTVFAAIGYLAFSLWGGWREVGIALADVGLLGMVLALMLSLLNYGLRFVRWQGYLGALGHRVPWKSSLRIYLAGFALTTTPGKVGEALRGVLLKHWGVHYHQSLAAFFSERLSDLFAIVLMTLFGLTWYPEAFPMVVGGAVIAVLGYLVVSQRRVLQFCLSTIPRDRGRIFSVVRHLFEILMQAQRCHSIRMLVGATLLSLLAWSAEALAFHWMLRMMGESQTVSFAFFVYAAAMLAGALSFMPGGLGGAEAVMVALLIWGGMESASAVAVTVLIRVVTLWFAVGIGTGMLLKSESGVL